MLRANSRPIQASTVKRGSLRRVEGSSVLWSYTNPPTRAEGAVRGKGVIKRGVTS